MRLLTLFLLAMISCLPKVAAAPTVPPAVNSPVEKTLKKVGPPNKIQAKTVEPLGPKIKVAAERSGTFDGPVSAPKSETQPAKSKAGARGTNRAKRLDRIASETVMNFFKEEGTSRFGLVDPEKNVRIVQILPDPDFPDRRIISVEQSFRGIPIFGANTTMEIAPGKRVLTFTSGFVSQQRIGDLSTEPAINWMEAIDRALGFYRRFSESKSGATPTGEHCAVTIDLTIFDPAQLRLKSERAHLAWHVRVDGFVVFIDAQNGSPILQHDDIQSAFKGRQTYDIDDGLQGQCGHNLVLDEIGPLPGAEPVTPDATKAHAVAKKAYDFFNTLGWNSYDDLGSSIDSNVRVRDSLNRYGQWDPYNKWMIFYPGIPNATDIVAHEFTHGVIQFRVPGKKGLYYYGESGALNEAFADFFGSQIEEPLNWTIGENVALNPSDLTPPTNASPLRDMANPHKGSSSAEIFCDDDGNVFSGYSSNGKPISTSIPLPGFYPKCQPWNWNRGQPDHYSEVLDPDTKLCAYKEVGNGCAHLNSGIFNKAMHLAANGGTHHGVQVQGIEKKKLIRIMFRTLRKIYSHSHLKITAVKSIQACNDLVGRLHINQQDCENIQKAFLAVGLVSP